MDTSSADGPSGWLHPLHPWGSRVASHRLPAPALIVFAAEQPYQMLWGPSWRAGSDADHVARPWMLFCRQQPLSLFPRRFHNPSSTCCVPLLSKYASDLDLIFEIPASQHRIRIPRSPQQSPPVNVGRADGQSPSADSDDRPDASSRITPEGREPIKSTSSATRCIHHPVLPSSAGPQPPPRRLGPHPRVSIAAVHVEVRQHAGSRADPSPAHCLWAGRSRDEEPIPFQIWASGRTKRPKYREHCKPAHAYSLSSVRC